MNFSMHRYYKLKRFKPNQIANCFEAIISKLKLQIDQVSFSASYSLGDETEESRDLLHKDIETICEIKDTPHSIVFSFPFPGEKHGRSCLIIIENFCETLHLNMVMLEAKNCDIIITLIEKNLDLEAVSAPVHKRYDFDAIEERLNMLEQKIGLPEPNISCFLSYRFNKHSKSIALELTRFLELLDVNVISGAGYEPRRVNEKVTARLNQPLDFLIYLVTKDGESVWTRDELTYAYGKGYALILIVETGVNIDHGLIGDWEYLEYDTDHIGDVFVGILEALRYVKEEKRARLSE